jgi:23S rRNA (cytidine1920-2'-O)/16S rRNA (cytidine1409-2'-O)-methyltransferase
MRLDLYLSKSGKTKSRERAKELIASRNVTVDGEIVTKPAYEVSGDETIDITEPLLYVSRGGLKLAYALKIYDIDVTGKTCLDIGASTGGFTDCLLQSGAAAVFTVDTGSSQLHPKIKDDPRVISFENADIRDFSPESFPAAIDFVSCDVSFISVTKILPKIAELLKKDGGGVILVKPQFELEKRTSLKNGIVKSEKMRCEALEKAVNAAKSLNLTVKGTAESFPPGKDGNVEYIMSIAGKPPAV